MIEFIDQETLDYIGSAIFLLSIIGLFLLLDRITLRRKRYKPE